MEYVDVFELRSEEDEEDDDLIPNQHRHNHWFDNLQTKMRCFVNYIYITLCNSSGLSAKYIINSIMKLSCIVCIVGDNNAFCIDYNNKRIFVCIGGYDLSILLSFNKVKTMLNEMFNGSYIELKDINFIAGKGKFALYEEYVEMEPKQKRRRISINLANYRPYYGSKCLKPRRFSTSIPVSPTDAATMRMNLLLNNEEKNKKLLDLQYVDKYKEENKDKELNKNGDINFYDKIAELFDPSDTDIDINMNSETDIDTDIETDIDIDININSETDIETDIDTDIDTDIETEIDKDIDFNYSKKMRIKWLSTKWEFIEIPTKDSSDIVQRYKDEEFGKVMIVDNKEFMELSEHMILR